MRQGKHFYAGGSVTLRGCKYQSIEPRFVTHRPTGDTAAVAGTAGFRTPVLCRWQDGQVDPAPS